jgi:hypothetical protein
MPGLGHAASIPRARIKGVAARQRCCVWPGMTGLRPDTPKQEQNRHPPIFARLLAARPGGPPCRFSSCSPLPGLADGQGFMRGFCAEPVTLKERNHE